MIVTEAEGGTLEESPDKSKIVNPLSTSRAELYHKLRAVDYEINAVASCN